MTDDTIRFNRPTLRGGEFAYMQEAILTGRISGPGIYSGHCEQLLEQTLGVGQALLTPSCSHALDMAAMLLDCGPGDEVIVPSFAFVTTAAAFANRGATPIFWDCCADTLNGDPAKLEALITPQTKAIVVLHYAGVGCAMDAIGAIAAQHHIPIVEDNAHGLFGKYNGQWLGSFGVLATQSFHETKNFTSGEGGALLINDPLYGKRAEIIRDKGTNRAAMFRGEADKYTWVDYGSSYVQSDILAGFLLGQLEEWQAVQSARATIWNRYHDALRPWAERLGVRQPIIPSACEQAYHLYYLIMNTEAQRDAFIAHMAHRKIKCVFHYLPLHLSPMGEKLGGKPGDCPVTEDASPRLVRLPMFNDMDEATQTRIIDAALEFSA